MSLPEILPDHRKCDHDGAKYHGFIIDNDNPECAAPKYLVYQCLKCCSNLTYTLEEVIPLCTKQIERENYDPITNSYV
jgi:hypothetical protein